MQVDSAQPSTRSQRLVALEFGVHNDHIWDGGRHARHVRHGRRPIVGIVLMDVHSGKFLLRCLEEHQILDRKQTLNLA